ncbi:MAG: hypothetical protein P8H90_03895, partial [Tateyamaria sp.]|nr:hypothetical protein [Tateyamaria sp.]
SGSGQEICYQSAYRSAIFKGANNSGHTGKELLDEITRSVQDENPANLSDLLLRRLGVGWDADQGRELVDQIAAHAALDFGWSDAEIKNEINSYHKILAKNRRTPSAR